MKASTQVILAIATVTTAFALTFHRASAGPDPSQGAFGEWERGTLSGAYEFHVPCLDETFLVEFELPYMTHRVWTPGGGFSALFKYLPCAPSRDGYITLTGLTSGTVYHAPNGAPALNETLHLSPGEVFRLRSHERYVTDDGRSLTLSWQFRFTVNATGDLIADLVLLDCRTR